MTTEKKFQDTLKREIQTDPEFAWEYVQEQNRYIEKLHRVYMITRELRSDRVCNPDDLLEMVYGGLGAALIRALEDVEDLENGE